VAELEARRLTDPGLKRFLEAHGGGLLPVWDLERLSLAALYFHPSLDVARAQWKTAQAAVQTAGARPNPTLRLAPQYTINPERGLSPWVAAVEFDVPIETAGKRAYRIAQARYLAEAARLRLRAQAWQVRQQVRAALLDHVAAQRRAALLIESARVQRELVQLLEQRLAGGAVSSLEVAPARMALLRTEADLAQAQRQAAEARARLAGALGLPAHAFDGVELSDEFPLAPELVDRLGSEQMRRLALHRRADLLAGLAEYAASQTALQLEIARQYPDVRLGPGYEYDQGENKWSVVGVALELPVLSWNRGPIAEAQARRAEAATRLLALQASILAELDQALAGWAAVQDQLRQLDALRAAQRQLIESVQARLGVGAADQYELHVAQAEAAQIELARLDALVQAQQVLGQLEQAVQVPFAPPEVLERNPRLSVCEESP
jgi:outer membrane protein TolC